MPRALRIKFEDALCRIASQDNNRAISIDENVIPLFLCWFKRL